MATQGRDATTRRRGWLGLALAVIVVAAITTPLVVLNSHKTAVLLGDSLTDESSTTLSSFLAIRGFSVHPEAIPGSGLLDTEVNWLARGRKYVAEYDPSVVTVEFIGDFGYLGAPAGVEINTPTFYRDWAQVAQQLEDILTSRGAQVYWVVGPPVAVPSIQTTITHLDRIYGDLHAPNTASGRPPLINVTPALTGNTGRYTEYLPGQNGAPAEVRTPDGIHLTIYGILLFAQAITDGIH
jgi:hypothetical protein